MTVCPSSKLSYKFVVLLTDEDGLRLEQRIKKLGTSRASMARAALVAELDRLDATEAKEARRRERAKAHGEGTYDSNVRLPVGFTLRSGRRVEWATATVEDLKERKADLIAVHSAQLKFYDRIISVMVKRRVGCFGDLSADEQHTLLSAS